MKRFQKEDDGDSHKYTEPVYDESESTVRESRGNSSQYGRKFSTYSRQQRAPITPRGSPFIREILQEPMQRIKMSSGTYDGTTNLVDYLLTYEGHMHLYNQFDAIQCKVFLATLSGIAQTWLRSLATTSITDFYQLLAKFQTHFVSNIRQERTNGEFMALKQGQCEILRDFLGRFNREAVTIQIWNKKWRCWLLYRV